MAASDTAAELASLRTSVDLLRGEVKTIPANMSPVIELCVRNGIDQHVRDTHKKSESVPPSSRKPAWVDPVVKYVIPALVAAALGAFGMNAATGDTTQQQQHAATDK